MHDYYVRSNVLLFEQDGWLLPGRFHSTAEEMDLIEHGRNVLVDFSDHGLLRLDGKDAVDFLNRISTNDFRNFVPGDSLQTVLTTEKGRVIDSIIVGHRKDHLLLIVSRGTQAYVKQWIEKFIIAEDLRILDQTGKYLLFAVLRPQDILESLAAKNAGCAFHSKYYSEDAAFYFFDAVALLPDALRLLTDRQVGNETFEIYCVQHGIPQCHPETIGECNPLELNLWDQISFTKGCYIGQEVIARLDTYKKIQRTLCRFRSDSFLAPGAKYQIVQEGKDIGVITNCARDGAHKSSFVGLALIRKEFALQGAKYSVSDSAASIIVDVVFKQNEIANGNNNRSR